MFRKHTQGKRSTNMLFVILRLTLSVVMFVVLLGGVYSAYKHFSGLDPLKLDPQAVLSEVLAGRIPAELTGLLSSVELTKSFSDKVNQKVTGEQKSKQIPAEEESEEPATSNLAFKFLLFADSHNDNVNLSRTITQAKEAYPDLRFIIGLGDYTEVGTIQELKNAKKVLDESALRYFLVPGDHDLWDCRNRGVSPISCFKEVFGPTYQSFTSENFHFILLNNSDNYTGFDSQQTGWIADELEKIKDLGVKGVYAFLHEPLYHPSSTHVMGWVENKLKTQAGGLIFQLKDAGVKGIFSGDIHYFSKYQEPKTGIDMITVGAVTTVRNPQTPRFAVVSVFEDGSIKVEDVEIK